MYDRNLMRIQTSKQKTFFTDNLLGWFSQVSETYFPWRCAYDPYEVLIAGILLRRTTREQVAAVFPEFINKFPNPASLADATKQEISEIIRPLGLHKLRGKVLGRVGKALVETERFPQRAPAD